MMKKLLLTLCLLAAVSAQAQEQDVFDKATAAGMARYGEINDEYAAEMYGRHDRARLDSLDKLRGEIWLGIDEQRLAVLEAQKPPFSNVFMEQLSGLTDMILYRPKQYAHLRERTEKLFNSLTDEQRTSKPGKAIAMEFFPFPATEDGDPLPDISLPDLDGTMHNLRTAGGGKWMLLDFWSTGCGGYIVSLPEVKAAAERYADRLVVVGINMNDGLVPGDNHYELWRKDSEKDGITWLNLATPYNSELINRLRILGRPEFFLISPDGVVVTRNLYGGSGYIDRLKEYMDGI